MKVLHVLCSSGMYGKEQCVLNLCKDHWSRESGLVNISPDQHLSCLAERTTGTHVFHIAPHQGVSTSSIYRFLSGCIKKFRPDVIHSHDYKSDILCSIYKRLNKPNIRFVATVHGYNNTTIFSRIELYKRLDILMLGNYDQVVAVSSDLAGEVGHNSIVIENGIDNYGPNVSEPLDQNILDFLSSGRVIMNVARLSIEKNQTALISAIQYLDSDVKLLILGEGPERSKLEALVKQLKLKDRVLMPGFVPNGNQYIGKAKVYIQPSFMEGMPISVLEAMVAKVPIIASEAGDMKSLIARGGAYITETSASSIALNLDHVIAQATHECVNNYGRLLRDFYSVGAMKDKYLNVYKNRT